MKNKFIHIKRDYGDIKHTIGRCTVFQTELENDLITKNALHNGMLGTDLLPLFTSISLERGWLDNKPNESCVPKGLYHTVSEYSNRFNKKLWEIYGVDGRSECKFHSANFWHQLNGCIALGRMVLDMDNDSIFDVTRSKDAMENFHDSLRSHNGKIVKLIIE